MHTDAHTHTYICMYTKACASVVLGNQHGIVSANATSISMSFVLRSLLFYLLLLVVACADLGTLRMSIIDTSPTLPSIHLVQTCQVQVAIPKAVQTMLSACAVVAVAVCIHVGVPVCVCMCVCIHYYTLLYIHIHTYIHAFLLAYLLTYLHAHVHSIYHLNAYLCAN